MSTPVRQGAGRSASRRRGVRAALSGAAAAAGIGACSACAGAGVVLLAGAGGGLAAGVAAMVAGAGLLRLTATRASRGAASPRWRLLTIAAGAYLAGAFVIVPLVGLATGGAGQEVLP